MNIRQQTIAILVLVMSLVISGCGPGQLLGPTLNVGATQVSPNDGMELVYVPAGEFLMGSTDAEIAQSQKNMPSLNFITKSQSIRYTWMRTG